MSWYRAGTAQVTTGSATVLGTGTQWVSKVKAGEAFLGPDNILYEVDNISSDLSLTLTRPYQGASNAAASYVIVPTQGYLRTLATQVADLISLYSAVPDDVAYAAASAVNAAASANAATLSANASETSRGFSEYARGLSESAATAAAASKDSAATSASTATTKATEASVSAAAALASQGAAGGSATDAAASASTASTKAGEASASASSASGSATTATTKAAEASASAAAALASKNAAGTSETNAASSASAADASKTAAAGSATTASTKAGEASASATAANQSKVDAQAIKDSLTASAVTSVAGRTGAVTLTKADVGLGNVSNLAPADLPISTATQTALNAKASLASATFLDAVTIAPTGLNAVYQLKAPSASYGNYLNAFQGNVLRWQIVAGGPDAAKDFSIQRFNDSGATVGTPISISRSTGLVYINGKELDAALANPAVGTAISNQIESRAQAWSNATVANWAINNPYFSNNITVAGTVNTNSRFVNSNGSGLLVTGINSDDGTSITVYGVQADPSWDTMILQAMHVRGQWAGWRFVYPGAGKEFQFRTDGSAFANGSWSIFSDRRLKTNIAPIEYALDKLDAISGNTYTREDLYDPDFHVEVPRYAGVIAQEVQVVLPEAVRVNEGLLTVDPAGVVALLVQAVKELRAEVRSLRYRARFA